MDCLEFDAVKPEGVERMGEHELGCLLTEAAVLDTRRPAIRPRWCGEQTSSGGDAERASTAKCYSTVKLWSPKSATTRSFPPSASM